MDDGTAFGARILEAREQRGWSRAELLRRLMDEEGMKIQATSLKRIEEGKQVARINEAAAICRVFGAPLELWSTSELWELTLASKKHEEAKQALMDAATELDGANFRLYLAVRRARETLTEGETGSVYYQFATDSFQETPEKVLKQWRMLEGPLDEFNEYPGLVADEDNPMPPPESRDASA